MRHDIDRIWFEYYNSIRNRDPGRIKPFLNEIAEFWLEHSDLRFCQLVMLIASSKDPFYIEDDNFLEMLKEIKG